MEFSAALAAMEQGMCAKRPNWSGYLFLDIDNKIKHAGPRQHEERFIEMEIVYNDWETFVKDDKQEKSMAQLEALFDESSTLTKRMYYLEEMIHDQHTAIKRISDTVTGEMDGYKKAVERLEKLVTTNVANVKNLAEAKKDTDKTLDELKRLMNRMIAKQEQKQTIKYTPPPIVVEMAQHKIEGSESVADTKPKKSLAVPRQEKCQGEKPALSKEEVKEMLALKDKMIKTGKLYEKPKHVKKTVKKPAGNK